MHPEQEGDFEKLDIAKIQAICPVLGGMSVEAAQGMIDNLTPEDLALIYQTYMPEMLETNQPGEQKDRAQEKQKQEPAPQVEVDAEEIEKVEPLQTRETAPTATPEPDANLLHADEQETVQPQIVSVPEAVVEVPQSKRELQTPETGRAVEVTFTVSAAEEVEHRQMQNELARQANRAAEVSAADVAFDVPPAVAFRQQIIRPAQSKINLPVATAVERAETTVTTNQEAAAAPAAIELPSFEELPTVDMAAEPQDFTDIALTLEQEDTDTLEPWAELPVLAQQDADEPDMMIAELETQFEGVDVLNRLSDEQFMEKLEALFQADSVVTEPETEGFSLAEMPEPQQQTPAEQAAAETAFEGIGQKIEHIFNSFSEAEEPISEELQETVFSLKQAIEKQLEVAPKDFELTAEIVENIVVILTTLGYAEPRKILLTYAQTHSKEEFISALEELLPDFSKMPEFHQYLLQLQNVRQAKAQSFSAVSYLLSLVVAQPHEFAKQAA